MISMQDRKYVDALVEQYLTPRHRQMTSKMKTTERPKTNFPRIRKKSYSSGSIGSRKSLIKEKNLDFISTLTLNGEYIRHSIKISLPDYILNINDRRFLKQIVI